ncbi:MAG: fasciclin domain-containing protein [Trueperaceae bacterium]|nr:fasciclin domain-containing protein [Trueperaceae bacterium]
MAQEGSSPSTPDQTQSDQTQSDQTQSEESAPAQPFESPPPQPEQLPEQGSDDASSEQSSEQSEVTPESPEAQTITDIVIVNDDFETLEQALVAADLTTVLAGAGPFTVFAPNDAAFARLTEDELGALLSDTAALRRLLLYHVAEGALIPESELTTLDTVPTASGDDSPDGDADGDAGPNVRQGAGGVYLNDARLVATDIEASNGLIHVIDVVLRPPQPSE